MTEELLPPPKVDGQLLDAQLNILDRQVLDVAEEPVVAVDDLELSGIAFGDTLDAERPPVIHALVGGRVLLTRLFGGRPPDSRLRRIEWKYVAEVSVVLRLGIRAEQLDITWGERWLRKHIIGRVPGGRHDPE
jgi:hypothetical protein